MKLYLVFILAGAVLAKTRARDKGRQESLEDLDGDDFDDKY